MRSLSDRQLQIINLAASGRTDKEIASLTGLALGTIRTYWDRLRQRYDSKSRSEVIYKALAKKASEDAICFALDLLPIFIWKVDPDGNLRFQNHYFNLAAQGCYDSVPQTINSFVVQEERTQLESDLEAALLAGTRYERLATFKIGPAGERKIHKMTMIPVQSNRNSIDHWIGFCREVNRSAEDEMVGFVTRLMV